VTGDCAEVTVGRHELFELNRRPQIVRVRSLKGCPAFPKAAPEASVDARSGIFEDVIVNESSGSDHCDSLVKGFMIVGETLQVLGRCQID